MLKAAMKEEQERARLPKPEEILQEAVGPAGRVEPVQPLSTQAAMKLLVIAREGAGFPVLGQFLTRDVGVFEHGEPAMEVAVVGNLFNCILSPEMVATFQQQVICFCFVISYSDKASMQCNVENGVEIIRMFARFISHRKPLKYTKPNPYSTHLVFQVKGGFGESPYFREECLLDSQAVCGDPLSYESM